MEATADALADNWSSLGAAAALAAASFAREARTDRGLADLPGPLAAAARALRDAAERAGAGVRAGAAPRWGPAAAADGPMQRETAKRRAAAGSSLRSPGRRVAIFTTASLPWMTGTAVNPLLRAAYLAADDPTRAVTLHVPWLPRRDQDAVFPDGAPRFDTPAAQAAWVKAWVKARTGLPCDFELDFYAGRYAPEKGSILPVGDPSASVAPGDADVAVLEEPEHLTWYHHGAR